MTTYIFYIKGKKLKISHETFWFIEQRAKKAIPLKFYEYVIRNDPEIKRFKEENKIAWRTLYVWILSAYENKEYKLLWYKVLAVKTFKYTGGNDRHLEGRMLIDTPDQVYLSRDFEEFCKDAIELFFEYCGYADFIQYAKQKLCMEKIEEFEDDPDKEVPFYIEIYDYDYARYPYEAKGKLPPRYWEDWRNAIRAFDEQIGLHAIHYWRYDSPIEDIVVEKCGYDDERFAW